MKEFFLLNNASEINQPNELKELLLSFTNSFDLERYLSKILRDEKAIYYTARKSYSHENGFDKITLFENNYCKMRLHIWLQNGISYSENIHNHRWDFCSKILFGSYLFENFQFDFKKNGEEYFEYEYLPKQNSDKYEMILRGKNYLSVKEKGIRVRNNVHILEQNELHKISSLEKITATLFLTGKSKKNYTNVFSKTKIDNSILPYRYISEEQLKLKLKQFLKVFKP